MSGKEFEFGRDNAFRLVKVTDREGNEKQNNRQFYLDRLGCVATDFYYDNYPSRSGLFRLNMIFVRDNNGQPINRHLHTSVVFDIEKNNDGFDLITAYSVYTFEPAEIITLPVRDEKNLIELCLSNDENNKFAAGYFYNPEGKAHELEKYVHLGMFQDSVLINLKDIKRLSNCVCRYFPKVYGCEFYNTIYNQQDYSNQILIHNTDTSSLEISFQGFEYKWTILPGGSKRINPCDLANTGISKDD